jgi:hypothetical protein
MTKIDVGVLAQSIVFLGICLINRVREITDFMGGKCQDCRVNKYIAIKQMQYLLEVHSIYRIGST